MDLAELLESLTEEERNFIANLDHGDDHEEHRVQLDVVIANQGAVDGDAQLWYPYAVIEIGKNMLHPGHEREFASCIAIVLHNVIGGSDKMNNVAQIISAFASQISTLDTELREIINGFVKMKDEMITTRRVQLKSITTSVQIVEPDVGAPGIVNPDVSPPQPND